MDVKWKLASTAALALSAMAAGKVVEMGWRVVTGHSAPTDDNDDATIIGVIAFAAVSAAVVAVAQRYAIRGAAAVYDPDGIKGVRSISS